MIRTVFSLEVIFDNADFRDKAIKDQDNYKNGKTQRWNLTHETLTNSDQINQTYKYYITCV